MKKSLIGTMGCGVLMMACLSSTFAAGQVAPTTTRPAVGVQHPVRVRLPAATRASGTIVSNTAQVADDIGPKQDDPVAPRPGGSSDQTGN